MLLTQAPLSKLIKHGEEFEEEPPEQEELDWWSKYYASLEEIERKVRGKKNQQQLHNHLIIAPRVVCGFFV